MITGLYVVFTPLLAAAVRRKPPAIPTISGAALSVVGFGMLTIGAGFGLNGGDILTIVCAVAFAAHIVHLSRLAPRHSVVPFTAIQLLVVAVLSLTGSPSSKGSLSPRLPFFPH